MIIKYKTDNKSVVEFSRFFCSRFILNLFWYIIYIVVTLYIYLFTFVLSLSSHHFTLTFLFIQMNINNHLTFYQHQLVDGAWKKLNLPNCLRNKYQFFFVRYEAYTIYRLIQFFLDLFILCDVKCWVEMFIFTNWIKVKFN